MRVRKILVPTDFSNSAQEAADEAVELARSFGASVTLLHVWQMPAYAFITDGPYEPSPALEEAIRHDTGEALEEEARRLAARGIQPATEELEGSPYDAIVRFAHERGFDLIVMGTHGRHGLSRFLLGSVAERVVRHAHIPVLTTRSRVEAAVEPAVNQP